MESNPEFILQDVTLDDAPAIAALYNHYIEATTVTFEETPVTADTIAQRIQSVKNKGFMWLVVRRGNEVLGFAYATNWRDRIAYRYSVEVSVYVKPCAQGKGIGIALYTELFSQLKAMNIQVVIGGITLPNPASVALHEKLGMHKVAHFEKVGFKFNQWLDVGYWQMCLLA